VTTQASGVEFTPDEKAILSRFFTNVDGPVFALVNLPEVVKGALFARYSRSDKSLRRLFLDEFIQEPDLGRRAIADYLEGAASDDADAGAVGTARARDLYDRIFTEYGDDSVAQLGGAHVACEDVSNIVTKVIERGRLMAYLEQSTRYIRYDKRRGGKFRYTCPPELEGTKLQIVFDKTCQSLFELYSELFEAVYRHFEMRFPIAENEPEAAYRSALRAKTCDSLRGLLPAATLANVGIFGSGQAYERLLLRMLSSPLGEARALGRLIQAELEKVIPSFVRRVDMEDRGVAWRRYLAETRDRSDSTARDLMAAHAISPWESGEELHGVENPTVELVEFDADGESKIAAAILFEHSHLSLRQAHEVVAKLSADEVASLMREYVGRRSNRRHLPGRAFESTYYTFDIVSDYGAFRDLQRHRMLTIDWQQLTPELGYSMPEVVDEVGYTDRWNSAMASAASVYAEIASVSERVASYVLPMAFRLRYRMQLNAREALYLVELRTSPQAHPEYKAVCNAMAESIRDIAGHRSVFEAMSFRGSAKEQLERREAEARAHHRKQSARLDSSNDGIL
jgi:thymidylate synthase ThyX